MRNILNNNSHFDFAFSFSGEETRQKVIEIAKELENLGFKVFIDVWYTDEMQKVPHPKDFLTDVFSNAKHVILVLNKAYMYELEKKANCKKDFNKDDGCYIKHEVEVISKRWKSNHRFLMKIKTENGNFDLNKYGINFDIPKKELNLLDILHFFGYQDLLTKKYKNTKENKLQIKEKIERLFNFHNINLEEWPLIVKEFTYDVIDKNKFYEVIDPVLINRIADKFKVDKQVFYGNSDDFYKIENYGFYKNVKNFSDYVFNEIYMKNGKMYILSERVPDKNIDEKEDTNRFALIFQIPLFEINNKLIYTYKIFDDGCRWGYGKCRFNLKSFLLCLRDKYVPDTFWQGSIIKNDKNLDDNLKDLASGNIKLDSLINGIDWYPEDFIDSSKNSVQVKESDELDKINKCKSYF